MYKRIVVKLSGEALSNYRQGVLYDEKYITSMLEEIIEIRNRGIQIAIVVGGGNIWRGASSGHNIMRVKSDQIGLLATIQNAIYIQAAFESAGVSSVIQTPFAVSNFTEIFSADSAVKYLEEGRIVIFAGGIGHPYFSSDMVCALRALEIHADGLFYTKNAIKGICERDPKDAMVIAGKATAKLFKVVSCKRVIEDENIKAIDDAAICLLRENKRNFLVFGFERGSLLKACLGEQIGTSVTYEDKESVFYAE